MRKIISFVIFYTSVISAYGGGIWVNSLDIDGVSDFSPLHYDMAKREAKFAEDLVTLKAFIPPPPASADRIPLFSIENALAGHIRPLCSFNSAGVLRGTEEYVDTVRDVKLKPFKDGLPGKNIALGFLGAITRDRRFVRVPLIKEDSYRFLAGSSYFTMPRQWLDIFLSRGNAGFIAPAEDLSRTPGGTRSMLAWAEAQSWSNNENIRIRRMDDEMDIAMRDRDQVGPPSTKLILDSEEEMIVYLGAPFTTDNPKQPTWGILKEYLRRLTQQCTVGDPIEYITLNIHSRLDACPVCLYRLHNLMKEFNTIVLNGLLVAQDTLSQGIRPYIFPSTKFFITYSSRTEYTHQGKSRRRVGMTEATLRKKLDKNSLEKLIAAQQVIQTTIDPSSLYLDMDKEDRYVPPSPPNQIEIENARLRMLKAGIAFGVLCLTKYLYSSFA